MPNKHLLIVKKRRKEEKEGGRGEGKERHISFKNSVSASAVAFPLAKPRQLNLSRYI